MAPRPLPSEKEVTSWIRERRNWGRWGKDDQKGAINLITPAKRVAAARLVKSGRSVSLSRPFPKEPGPNNALPAQHFMKTAARGKGGFSADYYGIFYHGVASTHIDALCHTWDDEAMWNGRDPKKEITFDGARISRAAGTQHGQEFPPHDMEALIRSIGREPMQRDTLYRPVPEERRAASMIAGFPRVGAGLR